MNKRVLLIILDGFGEGKDYPGNAIMRAAAPTLKNLRERFPVTYLAASGNAVGVPEGTQGGSEVGHFTIGAGRQIFQTLEEINHQIEDGDFYKNPALLQAINHVVNTPGSRLHLLGMISDQGVHSHINHLIALIKMAKEQGVKECVIHAITDGRDVRMKSATHYVDILQQTIAGLGMQDSYTIATLIGRYYAMDRDSNWDRVQVAYDLYTESVGTREADAKAALEHAYKNGAESDYYIKPIVLADKPIRSEDAVIFFNFRTDRARQLTWALTGENGEHVTLRQAPEARVHPLIICTGDYSKTAPIAFRTPLVKNNLGQVIEESGLAQFRIAETEKYAHLTYFFNSQLEAPFAHEDRLMIDSPKCPSYAEKPEMSATGITDALIKTIETEKYPVIVCNFANLDLVGHSGNLEATIKAVETIDACLSRIIPSSFSHGYSVSITGDHGNAEYMLYEDGSSCPSHTTNPVPFILCDPEIDGSKETILRSGGALSDVASTLLQLLKIPQPPEMTGRSLII